MFRKALWSIAVTASICSAANANDIHRVVTTLDANNKSTTLFDSNVPLEVGKSGNPGAVLWITDFNPAGFSQEDTGKRPIGISPPDNGTVICVVEFPPVDDAKLASMDPNFMMKVVGPTAPARGVPPTNPLEHRTRTVDYAIIMSRDIHMMLRRQNGAPQSRRCRCAAGYQSCLAQPRQGAVPRNLRAYGFQTAVRHSPSRPLLAQP